LPLGRSPASPLSRPRFAIRRSAGKRRLGFGDNARDDRASRLDGVD